MRRLLIAAAGVVVLMAVAHGLFWQWAETRLEAGLEAWQAEQRAAGWIVTTGEPARGGWPTHAELIVPAVAISGRPAELPMSVAWGADRVVLAVSLIRPTRLVLHLGAPGRVRIGDGPDIAYAAGRLTATLPLDPDVPTRAIDVAGASLRLAPAVGGQPAPPLAVGLLAIHLDSRPAAAQGEPALAFAGSAQDVALPPPPGGGAWPLGSGIASVSVEGAITGPLPRAVDLAARARQWRDGGGTLEVRRLAMGWGPLGLSGSATLALDDRLQPMGAASAHVLGAAETVDALAAGHALSATAAAAARAMVALMARAPDGGGAPQLDVPLTLQNRTLAMGRLPLGRAPEWVWPGRVGP